MVVTVVDLVGVTLGVYWAPGCGSFVWDLVLGWGGHVEAVGRAAGRLVTTHGERTLLASTIVIATAITCIISAHCRRLLH